MLACFALVDFFSSANQFFFSATLTRTSPFTTFTHRLVNGSTLEAPFLCPSCYDATPA